MKTIALALIAAASPGLAAAQSASYALDGFAVSLHQAQVTGLAGVQEELGAPLAASGFGFPASPAQALVLTPRAVAGTSDMDDDRSAAGRSGEDRQLLRAASAPSDR